MEEWKSGGEKWGQRESVRARDGAQAAGTSRSVRVWGREEEQGRDETAVKEAQHPIDR